MPGLSASMDPKELISIFNSNFSGTHSMKSTTLLLTTPNHTINAAINPKLPYDTEKDLLPVSIVADVPELLVSHPAAPFENFSGFVDYPKNTPGKLNYSSAGNGTLPHVTMELLLRRTGI